MNDTQWVFELESMNLEDEEKLKQMSELTELIRESVANMLGLNLLPIEDEETGLLRKPDMDEYVPLALATGRDDYVQMVMEKRKEFTTQELERFRLMESGLGSSGVPASEGEVSEMSPEQLETFMKDEGDVEFENTPEEMQQFMGKENQMYLDHLVLNKDDIDEASPEPQKARTVGKARKDLIEEVRRDRAKDGGTTIPLKIESDSILGGIPEKSSRSKITVEMEE